MNLDLFLNLSRYLSNMAIPPAWYSLILSSLGQFVRDVVCIFKENLSSIPCVFLPHTCLIVFRLHLFFCTCTLIDSTPVITER